MKIIGLFGYPLEHSFSNKYFTEKFIRGNPSDFKHKNFSIEDISMLKEIIIDNPNLIGFNVTIPYKKLIIPYLDEIDESIKSIGAVNCVKITRTGNNIFMKGYNTDIYGFEESLKPLLGKQHKQALILGNGGAAKAVMFVLKKLGISFQVVSREKSIYTLTYSELTKNLIAENKLIINTTPLGMLPDLESFPEIDYSGITKEHLLYDLIYNPEQTLFLRKGKESGAIVKNGLEMLYLQAEKSWEIFRDNYKK